MKKPHVFIGLPQHGATLSTATMRSVHTACIESNANISYQALGLSLLARNFNTLWIAAYKSGADFFILHHTDLGIQSPYPGVSWVDLLVERMYQLNAAAISVASPIKSQAGHFSMGLDLKAGNPYSLRRITARELYRLPTSFIARSNMCDLFDVDPAAAGAMIVNTGCLIMDLKRFPWHGLRWPGFNIVDSIQWSLSGTPQAFTEPEDWFASRWLHKYNIPFFATRELILDHYGGHTFYNQGLWGDEIDNTPVQPSIEQWHSMRGK